MVDLAGPHHSIAPSPNPADPPPFHRMSDDAFEEMCCALLAKEPGIARADLYGRPREPQFGVDVLGETERASGIEVISCKCRGQIKRNDLSTWSDDFLNHWDAHWKARRVCRFILAIAADLKSTSRQQEIETEKARFLAAGIIYEPWTPRLLQEKLRSHPGLVAQFLGREWVSRLCGATEPSVTNPSRLLEQCLEHTLAGEFEQAVACAENAARFARDAGDSKMLRNALQYATRTLGDRLITKRPDEVEARQLTSRIASHIDELETLSLPEAELAVEKALLARLDKRPDDALRFARAAEKGAKSAETEGDALLVQLQAYWQKGTPEEGLGLKARIENLTSRLERGEPKLVLKANWLRTLCRAEKTTDEDVKSFITFVRELVAEKAVPPARALFFVDEVVSDFGRAGDLDSTSLLLSLALEMATSAKRALPAATIALQMAGVQAELGNEAEARQNLGLADKWIDILKSDGDKTGWTHRKATALATRGKIEARLATKTASTDYQASIQRRQTAYNTLGEAIKFVESHEAELVGDFGPFRADLYFRLGDAAGELGRSLEAASHFRRARSDQIMADERFRTLGVEAWMREADALLMGGRPSETRSLLMDILAVPAIPDTTRDTAQKNIDWLDKNVTPVTEWFASDAAASIGRQVMKQGLRPVIAEQVRPLIEWFQEFPPKDGAGHAYSELFDIWGRGGFSRVVAAVRADPLNAISVDATCVEDIARWARMLCPLYDTVIVNWKGLLHPSLGIVPMPDNLGPPGAFGGQGYALTSSVPTGKGGWHVAVGWANFLPQEVSKFLATDLLSIMRSGRLVLLPAPLIGCTQSAVGWTDNFLVDTLLGGVVKTVCIGGEDRTVKAAGTQERLLDLSKASIPFIDNVPLGELDHVLNDTADWLSPLRRLLRDTLGSTHLRQERWDGLGSSFSDIRDACRQLGERWRSLTTSRAGADWHLSGATGAFSAMAWRDDTPGSDAITDLLRSVAGGRPDLGPWIPFWCLQQAGGEINWTRALDNRSIPPDEMAEIRGFSSSLCQGWLFPGDGGPGIAAALRLPN